MANSTQPKYDASAAAWSRARDVLAGENAVKAAGEKYLPRLDLQSDGEYAAYKARACFFGATSRTVEEYLELVFRRAPVLVLPECLKGLGVDCDLWGLDFLRYARRVIGEVLSVGRGGSLVLGDGRFGETVLPAERPVVSFRRAEQIVDWAVEGSGGRTWLSRLVLADGDKRQVFRMQDGACVHEVVERKEDGA